MVFFPFLGGNFETINNFLSLLFYSLPSPISRASLVDRRTFCSGGKGE